MSGLIGVAILSFSVGCQSTSSFNRWLESSFSRSQTDEIRWSGSKEPPTSKNGTNREPIQVQTKFADKKLDAEKISVAKVSFQTADGESNSVANAFGSREIRDPSTIEPKTESIGARQTPEELSPNRFDLEDSGSNNLRQESTQADGSQNNLPVDTQPQEDLNVNDQSLENEFALPGDTIEGELDGESLSLEQVLRSVAECYPEIEIAFGELDAANGKITAALGKFDQVFA
ncbi:MAG: hypothetical protein AAF623_21665, partial [Planctomycetota bacterium]